MRWRKDSVRSLPRLSTKMRIRKKEKKEKESPEELGRSAVGLNHDRNYTAPHDPLQGVSSLVGHFDK